MKRKISTGLFLVTLIALLITACAPAPAALPGEVSATQPAGTAITVKNADGSDFRLEEPAQHVISLAPSNTEILFALGASSQLIGREEFSNFPPEAAEIPSVGGSMGKYNLEEIARLQPDLVLASPLTPSEALQSLREVTPNVYVVPNPTELEGLFQNLLSVGALTGRQIEAELLVAGLRTRAEAVQEKVSSAAEKPKVFYELDATDPSKPWTAGQGSFINLLIELAGGQNIAAGLPEYTQLSQEELIVQNPDVILLGDALYGGITAESVAARPGWESIAAVQNGRVLPFNDDLVSRPGPRMVDGLEELAKILHPGLDW